MGPYSVMDLVIFSVISFIVIVIDFKTFKVDPHASSKSVIVRSSIWTGIYIVLALCFWQYIAHQYGDEPASRFLTGYTLEKTLAFDNLAVFVAIFSFFKIPKERRHTILILGLVGAIVFRAIMIGLGTTLAGYSPYIMLLFAGFVLYSAYPLAQEEFGDDDDAEEEDFNQNRAVRFVKKFYPVSDNPNHGKFFVKESGVTKVTVGFICLACIEWSDVMFSFDSVPAIIAVTQEKFLVFTASMCAVFGLRQMYFFIAELMEMLAHLGKSVVFVLIFIGINMILETIHKINSELWISQYHMHPTSSLYVVLSILSLGVIASLAFKPKET